MGETDEPSNQGGDDAWASLNESDDWHGLDATGTEGRGRGGTARRGSQAAGLALTVTAGPEVGRSYAIARSVTTVGRGKTNDIVLSDASISREHARLERREGGLFVVDLQSANGTFIDEERVSQASLGISQLVGFGQVRLRLHAAASDGAKFLAAGSDPVAGGSNVGTAKGTRTKPAAAPAKGTATAHAQRTATKAQSGAAAPGGPAQGANGSPSVRARPPGSPQSQRAALPAARRTTARALARAALKPLGSRRVRVALVLAILLAYGAVFWQHHGARGQAFRSVQEGIVAYREHRWAAAEQAFVTADGLVANYGLPKRWLAALSQARHDEALLEDAKEALRRGDLPRSRALLSSMHTSPLQEEVWQLEGQWREAEHARLLAAEAALQAHLPHEAETLLSQLDTGRLHRPDRVSLLTWQRRQSELGPLLAMAEAYAKRPQPKVSLWEQAASQSPAMRAGLRAFKTHAAAEASESAKAALGAAHTNEERRLLEDFVAFQGLWDTGLEEHRGKRAFAAIKVFGDAKELAARLVGPHNEPRRALDEKLADMYYVVGMQTLVSGKLIEAAEALRAALRLVPGHTLSQKRMRELEERAQRMVDEADFVRISRPERAKELLRQVVAILTPSNRLSERAKKLLATF